VVLATRSWTYRQGICPPEVWDCYIHNFQEQFRTSIEMVSDIAHMHVFEYTLMWLEVNYFVQVKVWSFRETIQNEMGQLTTICCANQLSSLWWLHELQDRLWGFKRYRAIAIQRFIIKKQQQVARDQWGRLVLLSHQNNPTSSKRPVGTFIPVISSKKHNK